MYEMYVCTLTEIVPDTAYVLGISISHGFPYMISAFPCFHHMLSAFLCFPYMVMLSKQLIVTAIVLDWALLWAAMNAALFQGPLLWRHNDKTIIVSWNTRGPEREPGAAIVDRQSINYLLEFKVICCIFPWNNSNCRLGRLLVVFNKSLGLRPSDTLSSWWLGWRHHERTGKQLFVKTYDLSFQSVILLFQLMFVCTGLRVWSHVRFVRNPHGLLHFWLVTFQQEWSREVHCGRCVRRIRQKSCRSTAVKTAAAAAAAKTRFAKHPLDYMLHNRFPWKRSGRRSSMWPPYSLRRNLSAAACRPCDRSLKEYFAVKWYSQTGIPREVNGRRGRPFRTKVFLLYVRTHIMLLLARNTAVN